LTWFREVIRELYFADHDHGDEGNG
jgi:hypothetical protein